MSALAQPDLDELRRRAIVQQAGLPTSPDLPASVPVQSAPPPDLKGLSTFQPPAGIGTSTGTSGTSTPPPEPLAKPSVAKPLPENPGLTAARTEYNRLAGSKAGVDTLPMAARIPLRILEGLGSMVAPQVLSFIPGTEWHHRALLHSAAGNLNEQESAENQGTKRALEAQQGDEAQARIPLINAQTEEARARTQNLITPQNAKDWQESTLPEVDPEHPELGAQTVWYNKNDPKQKVFGGAGVAPKPVVKEPKEGELPLGDRVTQLNDAMKSRYQVLHPNEELPTHYALPANATQKDFDRVDKLMESEERASGTKEQHAQTAELRRQTMALAQQNRGDKEEHATRAAAYKAYTPALDSSERFNVMAKNYEDAVNNHDQQAMLSLLANHLGMTMGLQKGARLTRDIIHEAEQSRPWLQGLAAKFDKSGYLSGVTLTPSQMRQMVNLGRERFSEDLTKGRNEARYMGANDEGPERTPNHSTMRYYLDLANNDVGQAKKLAAQDGWTVK